MSDPGRMAAKYPPGIAPRERALLEHGERRHRVASLGELRELGFAASTVRSRVAAGRFVPLHREVFGLVPGRPTREGRWLAAVLACGPGAALSHRSAAAFHGLQRGDGPRPDVTSPTRRGRTLAGVACHRTRAEIEAATRDEIPVTSVTRTLLDLAATSHPRFLESAIERAETLRVLDARKLLDRSRNRPGARALRHALIAVDPDALHTKDELERRVLAMCRRAGIPAPGCNQPIDLPTGPIVVDFLWAGQRVVLEADGREHHDTAAAFERDRRRDQALTLAGYRPLRTTWLQATREPNALATLLAALLA